MLKYLFLILVLVLVLGCGRGYVSPPTHFGQYIREGMVNQNHDGHSHGYYNQLRPISYNVGLGDCCFGLYGNYNTWYTNYRYSYRDPWCNTYWNYYRRYRWW